MGPNRRSPSSERASEQAAVHPRAVTLRKDQPLELAERVEGMHVLLEADLVTIAQRTPVTLREIGARTCLVTGRNLPPLDARVLLDRGRLKAFGHVSWSDGNHAEIRFEDHIDGAMLAELLPFVPPKPKPAARCYRPGFHAQLSADEAFLLEQMRRRGDLPQLG